MAKPNRTSSSESGVVWWITWILLTIVSFFLCSYLWTPFIAKHYGTMDKPGAPIVWVLAVFGSWMLLLLPLILLMYQKVDKAYEDARIARENAQAMQKKSLNSFRSIAVDAQNRRLAPELSKKLKSVPETIKKGHLVHVRLVDGRRIPHVFISERREVLGLYNAERMDFRSDEILDLEPVRIEEIPDFETKKWLRLDGATAP